MFEYNFAYYKCLNIYFTKCFYMFKSYKKYATIEILHYLKLISLCCCTNWKLLTLLQITLANSQSGPSVARTSNFSKDKELLFDINFQDPSASQNLASMPLNF